LDEERALVIAQQVARALDHAHKNGLVHRDVKPENVIVTREGVAKLCDLGLARTDAQGAGGQKAGTPDYISPEQARGEATVDGRSDLYSLGATLYHMLAGRPPFEAATPAAVLARHLTEPARPLNALVADVDPRTEALVTRLLAKSPAERFASAGELVQALDAIVRDLQQERRAAAQAAVTAPTGPAASKAGGAASKPAAPVARRRGPR
jgi:serine/threonine-protein kinase